MSYEARISRADPGCFIFLIDQSLSMSEMIGGEISISKQQAVADALNHMLDELIIRCSRPGGEVYDYFDVAIIGYGADQARSALGGALAGRDLVPISQIEEHPLEVGKRPKKISDGAGGVVHVEVDFRVWVKPIANGNTPMCQALSESGKLVRGWVSRHPRSYPPIIINLTDAEGNDGDPVPFASAIQALGTEDGNALLFNLHVSKTALASITFPDTDSGLPDAYARTLFGMSSVLPPLARDEAAGMGYPVTDTSRGFVYNADIVSVVHFLRIGTLHRPALR